MTQLLTKIYKCILRDKTSPDSSTQNKRDCTKVEYFHHRFLESALIKRQELVRFIALPVFLLKHIGQMNITN